MTSAEQTKSDAPGSFGERFIAYIRTLNGQANLISLVFCVITAILMMQILPETDIMGALGVLSIYIVVFLMVAGLARMVLKLIRRNRA
ncbi:MAG: hypothetical protein FJX66_16610 [Alphaproteobacteria bacterium]|nr:hypothetical protein [Alphaproteobacteria bacterium]